MGRATIPSVPEKNRLLARLPSLEYAQLLPDLEAVHLETKQVLALADEPVGHVYFPRDAVVSLIVPMEDGATIEGATVGNEGLVGLSAFLGNGKTTQELVCNVPGDAVRIKAATFREMLGSSLTLAALGRGRSSKKCCDRSGGLRT